MNESRAQNRARVAELLARARGHSLLSQTEMAERLGVSLRTLAGYERNENEPAVTLVVEWLRICDIPLSRLGDACEAWD